MEQITILNRCKSIDIYLLSFKCFVIYFNQPVLYISVNMTELISKLFLQGLFVQFKNESLPFVLNNVAFCG